MWHSDEQNLDDFDFAQGVIEYRAGCCDEYTILVFFLICCWLVCFYARWCNERLVLRVGDEFCYMHIMVGIIQSTIKYTRWFSGLGRGISAVEYDVKGRCSKIGRAHV